MNDALFLDLDGTLIDIAQTPYDVVIPHELVTLLADATRRAGGALAIITGRSIADVDRFLSPLKPVAAGVHGAELRVKPGGAVVSTVEPIDQDIVEAVRRIVAGHPGASVEVKRVSIAVHFRQVPALGKRLEAALQSMLEAGPDHLILARGRKVLEVVPRQVSKGAALEVLMGQQEFKGRRPLMVGDDVSDQSAFEAAVRLGGRGLRVAGEHFASAEADFAGPAAVRSWLRALAAGAVS